jgi:uncharacterized protein YneF (UPF0154 family)
MVIGSVIMINLLKAIIIGNFENSRLYISKRKMVDELKKCMDLKKTQFEAISEVLGQQIADYWFNDEKKLKSYNLSLEK